MVGAKVEAVRAKSQHRRSVSWEEGLTAVDSGVTRRNEQVKSNGNEGDLPCGTDTEQREGAQGDAVESYGAVIQ